MQALIQLQWSPAAFMQYSPTSGEVHAWLAADESALTTADGGTFLRHDRGGGGEERLYRANALPVHAWPAAGGERYELESIARRVLAFRCVFVS